MRVVILGVGNPLLKDEGIGIHVVDALREVSLPQEVALIDGGTSPDIPYLVEGADKLILIDAVKGSGEPGWIYRFSSDDIAIKDELIRSAHQIDLLENLKTMSLEPRETVIIGVEPKEVGWGLELSPGLKEKIPQIMEVVLEEVRSGGGDADH